jgi:hypothetical protein
MGWITGPDDPEAIFVAKLLNTLKATILDF